MNQILGMTEPTIANNRKVQVIYKYFPYTLKNINTLTG